MGAWRGVDWVIFSALARAHGACKSGFGAESVRPRARTRTGRLLEQDTGFVACVLDALGDMQLDPELQVRAGAAPGTNRPRGAQSACGCMQVPRMRSCSQRMRSSD